MKSSTVDSVFTVAAVSIKACFDTYQVSGPFASQVDKFDVFWQLNSKGEEWHAKFKEARDTDGTRFKQLQARLGEVSISVFPVPH
jgi:hypothetical protein